ncbi:phenazine biosynthesis-like domain-containing protein [Capsaspora owczarzaki ATCC 30864]|uniref:Phenazine biosynthesis-like domain-containing protein n=1 Tax=Capsaspora owczarzaki (strain ATCC 30864) TaxID=595528 RepID=A0A0D2WIN8_CAPO3|nr:phenazine biosynthesis-like domain-containing protein [Capsaspora owczarzaki ATCC 30864]KJE88958.1 phenazine biosynthesis-like domain-containing protein [Capsaspora owczarzaki ATCC 30864]|eukprot:XP_004365396.1 phenazine biosynthesis-like domain-containing protein [Capsaspora owczarzaki ATCC 30864]
MLPLFQVDAFTSTPFAGNPAAVCLLTKELPNATLAAIAAEMNLSETAYVSLLVPGGGETSNAATAGTTAFEQGTHFKLRWFTPTVEVALCGHATLATAHVLFNILHNQASAITFDTLSGPLVAKKGDNNTISIDLPLNPCAPDVVANYEETVKVATGGLPVACVEYSPSSKKLLIRLVDSVTRAQLEALTVDPEQLRKTDLTNKVRGVIVTLLSDKKPYDFISRYFAPWAGIPEDPVTGSAHTVLVDYWSREFGGQTFFHARQCSPRGGDLVVHLDRSTNRVVVGGATATVFTGSLNV